MTRDELIDEIAMALIDPPNRAKYIAKIRAAQEHANYSIHRTNEWLHAILDQAKPTLVSSQPNVPPTQRKLLDPLLRRAYIAGKAGAFNHRNNATMFMQYCDEYSDKYGMYLDEMQPQQRKVIAMMSEDTIAYEMKQNRPLTPSAAPDLPYEDGTIERALNEAIEKKVNEKGSDTAK